MGHRQEQHRHSGPVPQGVLGAMAEPPQCATPAILPFLAPFPASPGPPRTPVPSSVVVLCCCPRWARVQSSAGGCSDLVDAQLLVPAVSSPLPCSAPRLFPSLTPQPVCFTGAKLGVGVIARDTLRPGDLIASIPQSLAVGADVFGMCVESHN